MSNQLIRCEFIKYEPIFDIHTGKYIDKCPIKKGRHKTIYKCYCNGYEFLSKAQYNAHVNTKVHTNGLISYNNDKKTKKDGEKHLRKKLGLVENENRRLKYQENQNRKIIDKLLTINSDQEEKINRLEELLRELWDDLLETDEHENKGEIFYDTEID